ncbi:hypothetical protein FRAAL3155 [Frankia alni ACN14a]|uniref:Uncharacterized protein n=1 Tax=Frankia alni (strain DSM 45986 / CECT 9034 / ACN14a) TaxID=326424 RepID=Q0RL06_FRAAA|nr:hypothetical protein FRAAL3155 [Frankia alni ACN14a]
MSEQVLDALGAARRPTFGQWLTQPAEMCTADVMVVRPDVPWLCVAARRPAAAPSLIPTARSPLPAGPQCLGLRFVAGRGLSPRKAQAPFASGLRPCTLRGSSQGRPS